MLHVAQALTSLYSSILHASALVSIVLDGLNGDAHWRWALAAHSAGARRHSTHAGSATRPTNGAFTVLREGGDRGLALLRLQNLDLVGEPIRKKTRVNDERIILFRIFLDSFLETSKFYSFQFYLYLILFIFNFIYIFKFYSFQYFGL
jgi:hypothetical protein